MAVVHTLGYPKCWMAAPMHMRELGAVGGIGTSSRRWNVQAFVTWLFIDGILVRVNERSIVRSPYVLTSKASHVYCPPYTPVKARLCM